MATNLINRLISDTVINNGTLYMKRKHGPQDVPYFIEYLKKEEGDPRRHKSNCKYLFGGLCTQGKHPYYMKKCPGSAHCKFYEEEKYEQICLDLNSFNNK